MLDGTHPGMNYPFESAGIALRDAVVLLQRRFVLLVLQVIDMCVGKAACSVPNFAVPDPCGGTYKWASVGFTCQPEGRCP